YHKAGKIAEIDTWAQMWAVTDVKPEKDLTDLFITPFESVQKALDTAIEQKSKNASVLFLMDGGLTVPMVASS
ncbi:MAG: general glycosylation pathway protein, partial [Desulfobacteraceae bacterium]|nr:general glycosylation pathway protein [Desulfobacteraceae bacterium]